MNTYEDLLSQREKSSGVPISIGTGMALDAILGTGEFAETTAVPPINNYRAIWFNLRTLFRNTFNAFTKDVKEQLSEGALLDTLMEDISIIIASLHERTDRHFEIVFYMCEYKSLQKEFPNAKHKTPTTAKQKSEHAIEEKTLALFFDNVPSNLTVKQFDTKITEGSDNRTLINTHYPLDLLWHRKFNDLTLLESHTGALKQRTQWYTKLTGGKYLTRIPFNRLTIQLFGDGNGVFSTMQKPFKDELIKLASENRWTPATTNEKVKNDLNKIYDPRVKSFYLGLLRR